MKSARSLFAIFVGVLAVLGLGGTAWAFHAGGVAECNGCHSMHSPASATMLLVGSDQSSTCLSCHEHAGDTGPSSYHISTAEADMPAGSPPLQQTPGGDFGWVKKTYVFTLRSVVTTEKGQWHGHNIIADDYGYLVDTDNPTAPGGTFDSNDLSCISCHDPHSKSRRIPGNEIVASTTAVNPPIQASGSYNNSPIPGTGRAVGVYRLLGGSTYSPAVGFTFPGPPPAVAPSTYNAKEDGGASTYMVRVAYGSVDTLGNKPWGQWCATCHPDMESDTHNVHPVDGPLGTDIKDNYDLYRGSGKTYGTNTDAYWSLVPFAENNSDYEGTLRTHANRNGSYKNGPASENDEVMCLSCHRAHASGFKDDLRWNMEAELDLVNALYPGIDSTDLEAKDTKWNLGRTQAEMKAAYYYWPESRFGDYQRVLCNKCHNKEN